MLYTDSGRPINGLDRIRFPGGRHIRFLLKGNGFLHKVTLPICFQCLRAFPNDEGAFFLCFRACKVIYGDDAREFPHAGEKVLEKGF